MIGEINKRNARIAAQAFANRLPEPHKSRLLQDLEYARGRLQVAEQRHEKVNDKYSELDVWRERNVVEYLEKQIKTRG